MKTFLIIVGILALLLLIPLGAYVRYDSEGFVANLIAGPIRIKLFPRKKKKSDKKDKHKSKTKKEKKNRKPKEESKNKKSIGGLINDFYPFVKLAFHFLGHFFHKIRVKTLILHVSFGGAEDAAKAAINYGRAWGVIGVIMASFHERMRIKTENVSASCDFTSGEMRIFVEIKAVILLFDLLAMAIRYGLQALKIYLNNKKRKNPNYLSIKAVQKNESSSS